MSTVVLAYLCALNTDLNSGDRKPPRLGYGFVTLHALLGTFTSCFGKPLLFQRSLALLSLKDLSPVCSISHTSAPA